MAFLIAVEDKMADSKQGKIGSLVQLVLTMYQVCKIGSHRKSPHIFS